MSKTIWKFTLTPECEVDIPAGGEILSVREQGNEICMWVLVDPNANTVKRRFITFGTGHRIPSYVALSFIGTVLLMEGTLVFHVFEWTE